MFTLSYVGLHGRPIQIQHKDYEMVMQAANSAEFLGRLVITKVEQGKVKEVFFMVRGKNVS